MRGVSLVRLEERHLARILEIEKASNSAPWSENSFRNELDHEQGVFVVAERNRDPVGFGAAWVLSDEAHIINLAVDPENRRQGLATRLVHELIAQCEERGATCATLEVRVSNSAAIGLYEGMGFRSVGTRKRYYPDNREDALVMWLYDLADVKTRATPG